MLIYFDIATRRIGGKYFDIFVDDIGLMRDDIIISALTTKNEPMLVGNLVIANHDEQGNTTSLTNDDLDHILGCIATAQDMDHPEPYPILMQCEY